MRSALKSSTPLRERGRLELKGKSHPVPVYSVAR
jgi:hypothetical protein